MFYIFKRFGFKQNSISHTTPPQLPHCEFEIFGNAKSNQMFEFFPNIYKIKMFESFVI